MTYAAVAVGGMSLGGLSSSKSSKSPKEANAIARETLNFNKQRYNDYKKMYGGLEQQLVNDANKGVVADLGGVTARLVIQPRSLKPTSRTITRTTTHGY